jgi:hypothetical protein
MVIVPEFLESLEQLRAEPAHGDIARQRYSRTFWGTGLLAIERRPVLGTRGIDEL